jgi:hypothetical protein
MKIPPLAIATVECRSFWRDRTREEHHCKAGRGLLLPRRASARHGSDRAVIIDRRIRPRAEAEFARRSIRKPAQQVTFESSTTGSRYGRIEVSEAKTKKDARLELKMAG